MDNSLNKLANMLKTGLKNKYCRLNSNELINIVVQLEINKNELEKKIENLKCEIFKLKQDNMTLISEIYENNINIKKHDINIKSTYKSTIIKEDNVEHNKENNKESINIIKDDNTDHINNMNETIVETKINTIRSKLSNINEKELTTQMEELKNENNYLKESLSDKNLITNMLYKEIESLKFKLDNSQHNKADIDVTLNNNNNNKEFTNTCTNILENFDTIKATLIDFLKSFNIDVKIISSDNTNSLISDIDEFENVIGLKIKELKLLLVDLKKINIKFKSTFSEYNNDVQKIIETYLNERILEKIEKLNAKQKKIFNKINKFISSS